MNGFSKLSIISFLMLLLVGAVYFNSQVQFNPVEAQWELAEEYQTKPITYDEEEQDFIVNYLEFDGQNDYIDLPIFSGYLYQYDFSIEIGDNFSFLLVDEFGSVPYIAFDGRITLNDNIGVYVINGFSSFVIYESEDFNVGDIINVSIIWETNQYLVYINDVQLTQIRDIQGGGPSLIGLNRVDHINGRRSTDFNELLLFSSIIYDSNGILANYDFNNIDNNILYDSSSNLNHANIIGSTWQTKNIGSQIIQITNPAIDSYQVFENIRNNAPTVNPLSFMDTIITIPQKMVTYTDTFFNWIGFNYRDNILEPASEVSSELADTYKWYYNIFEWVRGFGE